MADSSFPADDPARMFCREYRWSRFLTKWESLPHLRLEPRRVLYDCSVCSFTNTIGLTCPWCMGVCGARVSSTPCARRRISCPQLLSEAQREQIRRLETRRAMTTRFNRDVSSQRAQREGARVRVRPRVQTTHRQKHRKAGIHSTADIVATITYDVEPELKPFLTELMIMHDNDQTTNAMLDHTKPQTDGRPNSAFGDTKSICTTSTSTTSQRTLRRKQRIAALRKRSSRSLRKHAMPILSKTGSRRTDDCEQVVTVQAFLPSRSPSPATVPLIPLGHPERPLYTAIRKNMSPPPGLNQPRSDVGHGSSLHTVLLERGARSLDMPRPATLGRSYRQHQPIPPSDWTSGCSLTGEAELRPDLIRCRSADVVTQRSREVNLGGVVREKVKNFGKGLKELLRRT